MEMERWKAIFLIFGTIFLFINLIVLEVRSSVLEARCEELEEKNKALEKAFDEEDREEFFKAVEENGRNERL